MGIISEHMSLDGHAGLSSVLGCPLEGYIGAVPWKAVLAVPWMAVLGWSLNSCQMAEAPFEKLMLDTQANQEVDQDRWVEMGLWVTHTERGEAPGKLEAGR